VVATGTLTISWVVSVHKTNLTLPNQSRTPYPNPAGGHQRPPSADLKLNFQNVVPDDLFKKLPKFGQIKTGTAKVHSCQNRIKGKVGLK
jgi:hypothetical protein